jgi:vacuolar-type H+-ATPase subunit E/Vma4
MGYEELIRDLQREAARKQEAVSASAREEARQIIADAMLQCDRLEQEFLGSMAQDLEQERARLLNRARREARMGVAQTKSDLVRLVFTRLEERLKAVASEKRYPSLLERLINETKPEWPEGEIVIRADAGTCKLLGSLMEGRAVRYEPVETTSSGEIPYGGFELSNRDETVVIRNTFRSRFSKARPDLLVELYRLLFGEIPAE